MMSCVLRNSGLSSIKFLCATLSHMSIVTFIVTAAKGLSQWHQNNQSPRLTVEAEIVSRHEDVSVHHHNTGNGAGHISHSTTYYVTFQVASGDRMEFQVPRREYGFLVEGDRGRLTFQGTRFLGFERM